MRDGLVVVDKPAGWTSHDVVARCRSIFGQKRVGHGGTLDPDATGVLLVGLGKVTRLLRFLTPLPKRYEAELVLGVETTTLDASGEVVARHDMGSVTPEAVRATASTFIGEIEQVPPMVSAVKIGGQRLHRLARQGVEIDRPARRVVVDAFDVEPSSDPEIYRIAVTCSSGTYVRSLAADLGRALGGGAHLRCLRRLAVGSFTIDDARPLDDLHVLPPAEAMRDYPKVVVSDEVADSVSYGRPLAVDAAAFTGTGPWAVVNQEGSLLAMYEAGGIGATPTVVIASR